MTTRLVEHALLARMRPKEPGLRTFAEKARLLTFLRERLDVPFERRPSSKELAAWFYFAHRGVRWTPAHLGDLSCFVEPILPLSDLRALALAIRSGAWANFDNTRVRSLNHRLLPEVSIGYSNGQSSAPRRWPRSAWDKLAYEYGKRAFVYARGQVANRAGNPPDAPASGPDLMESPSFCHYFDLPFRDAAAARGCSRTVSRAAITLNSALRYLDGPLESLQAVAANSRRGGQHVVLMEIYARLPAPLKSVAASLQGYRLQALRYGPETEAQVEQALERETWDSKRWAGLSRREAGSPPPSRRDDRALLPGPVGAAPTTGTSATWKVLQ